MDFRLFLIQRVLSLGAVLIGSSLVIFIILRFMPGDPVTAMMGFDVDRAQMEEMRELLGLNDPVLVQYFNWLIGALQGDLGMSIMLRREVSELLIARFPTTLLLAISSLVVALVISIPAGVLAGRYKGRAADHISRLISLAGVSMPNFWLGLLLILFFAVYLRWLPPGGFVSPMQSPIASAATLILPAITLGTAYAATMTRMLRASMVDVLQRDYVAVARAMGVRGRVILWRDAFRNALLPTVTVSGFAFGYMLAGTIIVEVIFNIP